MRLEAVESRFGIHRAPGQVEILSDDRSAYTAKDTRIFAQQLGLKPRFTPVKCPQSNGMLEAFVKTLKRDYVRVNPLPGAESVLSLIRDRIEDYNEDRPRSGLKWKSPREFIRTKPETAQVSGEMGAGSPYNKDPANMSAGSRFSPKGRDRPDVRRARRNPADRTDRRPIEVGHRGP